MRLIHYSRRSGLKVIDPANIGQGAPSTGMQQGVPDIHRSYWYLEGTAPENIVTTGANTVYRATLHPGQRIYDTYKDPDKIMSSLRESSMHRRVNPGQVTSDEYMKAIKDAGYHGFVHSGNESMKNVVALFHPQDVEAEEPIAPEHHGKAQLLTKSEDEMSLGHHFLFTTENSMYPKSASGTVEDVVSKLKNLGEDARLVDGHYGAPETSIMVKNPKDIGLLHRLAYAHGQESAIQSDGHNHKLYFYHGPKAGKYEEGSGTQWFTTPPDDFYTGISDKKGNVAFFRHHIDGKELKEGDHVRKVQEMKFDDPWDQAKHDRGGDEEYAKYNEGKLFNKLRKDEEKPPVPQLNLQPKVKYLYAQNGDSFPHNDELANYIDSINGDQIDESKLGRSYAKHKKYADIPDNPNKIKPPNIGYDWEIDPNETITPKADLEDLYRAYKNSPHHPRSLALKYMVHRIENAHAYKGADPGTRDALDADFLAHHQLGDAGKKNGHVTAHALRKLLLDAPNVAADLIDHKNELHNFLRRHSGQYVKDINGVPSVALTRGLNTKEPGRDHALASYSNTKDAVLGEHEHHRWVPLNNLWYSYDVGPEESSSENYGPEKEFLVSPHKIVNAQKQDVHQLVPRDHHKFRMSPSTSTQLKIDRGDRVSPQDMANHLASYRWYSPKLITHSLINHPDLPEDFLRGYIDHVTNGENAFPELNHFHGYGKYPVRQLPPDLLNKIVQYAIKRRPDALDSIIRAQGKNLAPETKKLIMDHDPNVLDQWTGSKLAASEKPFDLEKMGMRGDWQKEGYTVGHTQDNAYCEDCAVHGDTEMRVHVLHNGKEVAHAHIGNLHSSREYLRPRGISVDLAHRRKGLASAMYQYAEKVAGKPMDPSDAQSADAQALWAQPNRPFGKSENLFKNDRQDEAIDHLLSFVHPHDMHAIKATLVNHGYPVDDKDEIMTHLDQAVNTTGGRERMVNSLSRLGDIRQKAYSNGARQAKAFDDNLKDAHRVDMNRMAQSWHKIQDESKKLNDEWVGEDLHKALNPRDFYPIHASDHESRYKSESDPSFFAGDFDASSHVNERKGHDPYVDVMEAPGIFKGVPGIPDGSSPKMLHKIKGATYMAKPYHLKRYSDFHNAPGWATLTTKDLYDAGGMGHMAEDVRGGIHQGIPMTLHKFSPGFKESRLRDSAATARQGDMGKIAIMDFLTNNIDRHSGNLFIGNPDQEGFRPLKAIDHESSFSYLDKPRGKDSLWNYVYNSSGLRDAGAETIHQEDGPPEYMRSVTPELKNWWKSHSENIRKTFLHSLRHVLNPDLKEHMRKGFMQRYDHMNHLVQTVPDDDTLFSKRHGGINMVKPHWWTGK